MSRQLATSCENLVASTNFWSHWRPVSRNFEPWVKTIETACWDLVKGDRNRLINRGDHLIEVKITIIKGHKIWDFDN